MTRHAIGIAAVLLGAGTASAQMLVVDSTGDRVMMFSSVDGSLIDANWLSDAGAVGWQFSTPKEAQRIGNEIWVADQVEDAVLRFDLNRNYLGSITTGVGGVALDNLRSLGTDGSTVWVTSDGGGVTDTVTAYDTSGNALSSFTVNGSSPFDCEPFMGDLLITDSGAHAVLRHDMGGGFVNNFATGISFPEQLVVLSDNSVIVADAIDADGIEGVWHYNADGSVRAYLDTQDIGGPTVRGGNMLDNGDYILAASNGVWTAHYNGASFDYTLITADANGQYVTRMIPTPGALALLGFVPLATLRRRR